jgi:hypothetical protein
MPIISGEWGYATHAQGLSLETQADFLTRQQLFNLLQGIPISIWYDSAIRRAQRRATRKIVASEKGSEQPTP